MINISNSKVRIGIIYSNNKHKAQGKKYELLDKYKNEDIDIRIFKWGNIENARSYGLDQIWVEEDVAFRIFISQHDHILFSNILAPMFLNSQGDMFNNDWKIKVF